MKFEGKKLRTAMQFLTFGSMKNANICVKFQQQNWGQHKLQHAHTSAYIQIYFENEAKTNCKQRKCKR